MSDISLQFSTSSLLALGAIPVLALVWVALLVAVLWISASSRPVETKRNWQWTGGTFLIAIPLALLGLYIGIR
jgi:hypothetical protein